MEEIDNDTIIKNGKTFHELAEQRRAFLKKHGTTEENSLSFEEIFDDLSRFFFSVSMSLNLLNLSNLKGAPDSFTGSYISLEDNPYLKDISDIPDSPFQVTLYLDIENSELFCQIMEDRIKNFNRIQLSSNSKELNSSALNSDIVALVDNFSSLKDIIENGFEKLYYLVPNKGYQKFNYAYMDRIYSLLRKLNFNKNKLKRALDLIEKEPILGYPQKYEAT